MTDEVILPQAVEKVDYWYIHPLLQATALAMGITAAYTGITIYLRRTGKRAYGLFSPKTHMRYGSAYLTLVSLGVLLGIATLGFNGIAILTTLHAWLGLSIVSFHGMAAYIGVRMRRGKRTPFALRAHKLLNFSGLALFIIQIGLALRFIGLI